MQEIITCENISFSYRQGEDKTFPVFEHLDFAVEKGQFVAVLGHNGSGKSTLAKHFNAILLPDGGTVWVGGIDTKNEERLLDIRRQAGMVFQNPDNQIVATIVEEDVAFALENLGVPSDEIRRRVDDALKSVDMYDYRNRAPHQLSGGQKQRVAIAGIIAMRPECIILDEPTAMLDPRGRREVIRTVRELRDEFGITVVLITHFMDEAARCERVVVMDDGKIILDGTPGEVFAQVELLKSVGLDVPQASELAYELRRSGVNLPNDIVTGEQFIEAFQILSREAGQ